MWWTLWQNTVDCVLLFFPLPFLSCMISSYTVTSCVQKVSLETWSKWEGSLTKSILFFWFKLPFLQAQPIKCVVTVLCSEGKAEAIRDFWRIYTNPCEKPKTTPWFTWFPWMLAILRFRWFCCTDANGTADLAGWHIPACWPWALVPAGKKGFLCVQPDERIMSYET